MIILKIIVVLAFMFCLLSVMLYIYLLYRGDSSTIYMQNAPEKYLNIEQKVLLLFSGFGVFFFLYQGAEAMLFWIPYDWGSVNEGGEFKPLRESIALLFSFFGGAALISFLTEAGPAVISLKHAEAKLRAYQEIFQALDKTDSYSYHTYQYLQSVKSKAEDELSELNVSKSDANFSYIHRPINYYPESKRFRDLEGLIFNISKFQDKCKKPHY